MSVIFATQLTAIATAVLAVFAIVTAGYAIKAFGLVAPSSAKTGTVISTV